MAPKIKNRQLYRCPRCGKWLMDKRKHKQCGWCGKWFYAPDNDDDND